MLEEAEEREGRCIMRSTISRVRFVTKRRQATYTHPSGDSYILTYRAVTGLQIVGLEPFRLHLPHQTYGEHQRVDDRNLPSPLAERLDTFARRHLTGRWTDFNSITFMMFVCGFDDRSTGTTDPFKYTGRTVPPSRAEAYAPYLLTTPASSQLSAGQGAIGFAPGVCMTVMYSGPGTSDSQLIIAPAADLTAAYASSTFVKLNHAYRY